MDDIFLIINSTFCHLVSPILIGRIWTRVSDKGGLNFGDYNLLVAVLGEEMLETEYPLSILAL